MFLVLSRKQGQTIEFNGPGKMTIAKIDGNRVKVLCEASPDVSIRRGELERKEPTDGRLQTDLSAD
jgi:sRNA-binding carbon storage regulator CsrA